MVTIQALALIMGVKQSPAYLSIAFQDIAKGLEDEELRWFLQFLRYLDDLQIGISARELMEFQEKTDLEDADLTTSCQDPDCCSFVGDLPPPQRGCAGGAGASRLTTRHSAPLQTWTLWKKHVPLSVSESCKTRSSIGNG